MNEDQPRLTPESAKALADRAIESSVIPKKVPHPDDIDGQTKAVVGALSSALLFSCEMPVSALQPLVGPVAEYMVSLGIRQTEHIDLTATQQHTPAWVIDGMRQESVKLPPQPEPTEAEPVEARTAEAPKCPKRIASAARAVKR